MKQFEYTTIKKQSNQPMENVVAPMKEKVTVPEPSTFGIDDIIPETAFEDISALDDFYDYVEETEVPQTFQEAEKILTHRFQQEYASAAQSKSEAELDKMQDQFLKDHGKIVLIDFTKNFKTSF